MTHPPVPALESHLHFSFFSPANNMTSLLPFLLLPPPPPPPWTLVVLRSNDNRRPWWNDNYDWVVFSIWERNWSGNNPSRHHILHVGISWNFIKEFHYRYVRKVNWQKHVDEIECIVLVPYNFIGGWEFMPCLFWGHSDSY